MKTLILKFYKPFSLMGAAFLISASAWAAEGNKCTSVVELAAEPTLSEFYSGFETTASSKLLKVLGRSERLLSTQGGQEMLELLKSENIEAALDENGGVAISKEMGSFTVVISFMKLDRTLRVSSRYFKLIDKETGRVLDYGERPKLSLDAIAALVAAFKEAKSIYENSGEYDSIWFVGLELNNYGSLLKEMLVNWGFEQHSEDIEKGKNLEQSSGLYLMFNQGQG